MVFFCLHHDRKILENLVKSRKQISKHQNQGYWKFCSKIKEKNRIVRVPKCLTQELNCPGAEMSPTGAEVSWCRSV